MHIKILASVFIVFLSIGAVSLFFRTDEPALVDAQPGIIVLLSHKVAPEIQGYGGHIPLRVFIGPNGTITNIDVLKNNETFSYTGDLSLFVKQFIGKTFASPLSLGYDIDGISGATISHKAITNTIHACLAQAAQKPHSIKTPPINWATILIPVVLLALALTALLLKNTLLRWAAMLGGFIYFGLITKTMLSIIQIANAALGNIPGFFAQPLWFMTLLLGLAATFVVGRIYCGSLCPFALLQDLLFKLFGKRRVRTFPISVTTDQNTRYVKYALLFLVLGLCFIRNDSAAANIEVFITLFTGHGSTLAAGFLCLMIILAIFYFRFWCTHLCPVGALTGLAGAFSFFKIRVKPRCARCAACISACPTHAISLDNNKRPLINAAECILCGNCLNSCVAGQLEFGPHACSKK
ncbi:MAG: FMN-binding protein [Candidatus Omnitrophica bacterium]|nr:FMN-binding protein [Candidatus Omnitrophota bacterium]